MGGREGEDNVADRGEGNGRERGGKRRGERRKGDGRRGASPPKYLGLERP